MVRGVSRRSFLKKAGAIVSALPFASKLPESIHSTNPSSAKLPILLCSRGEKDGHKVLEPAWKILADGGNVLDAVERGANVMEQDPEDSSVGYGGLPNEEGVVQLDASIMYGPTHNCGSVMALESIKTPCSVARLVMERTDHIQLVGEGALRFARAHGFKEETLLTEKSRIRWLKWKENLSDKDDWLPPADGKYATPEELERSSGTINVLGIDANGDVAGITTTSGLAWKIPGRVGDSPIIGAGLYVDNEVGAAGATGRGEEVIRTCGSVFVVEKMRSGMSPQQACEAICQRIIDINGGPDKVNFNDKFVAINRNGEAGCATIRGRKGKEAEASFYTEDGITVLKATYLIEQKQD
ncbi:N(4)-(beta-N-acetylglucosaminyl)-L-asparaginase [bacterium]|nr:N(4)-(beta-N-acetylglucosaminyl)-L-asparaginase [bacterium]